MTQPLAFHPGTSFDSEEQETLRSIATLLEESSSPESQTLLKSLTENVERVGGLAHALAAFPPIFGDCMAYTPRVCTNYLMLTLIC